MEPTETAAGPLAGTLVLSLEQAVAAPFATCRLADAGARVIKVERASGDFARHYDSSAGGQSAYFAWLNRGKESLVADIKQAGDRALLQRIASRADVFVQNLGPGAARRAGLDSKSLRERNPQLITCDISGYGEEGPFSERKAYDLLVQAESGLASITGTPDAPGRVGISVCDIATGVSAHAAILEALLARQATGLGQSIHVSLFDSTADWMAVPLLLWDYEQLEWPRVGLAHPTIAPYGVYDLAGSDRILIAVQNDAEFERLAGLVLERSDLSQNPHFRTNPARAAHRRELDSVIEPILRGLRRQEAATRLDAAGIAYGFLNSIEELASHPHLRRISVASPTGPVEMAAPAAVVAGHRLRPGPIPALGAHGTAIRDEFGNS